MNPQSRFRGNPGKQAVSNELFSTAVLTATIVKIFALIMIVSLIYNRRIWLEPGVWVVGGGVVVAVFSAAYFLGLRLLGPGPRGTAVDLAYPVFSLLSVMAILLFTGNRMHFLNTLFFFPVIIATLMLGRRGMAAVPATVVFMLGMNLYYGEQLGDWCMVDNIMTSVVLVFTAWLVGEATELSRRANEELEGTGHLLRTVLDALPVGVLTMNRAGEVLSVNRYLRALIGSDGFHEERAVKTIRRLFAECAGAIKIGELRDTFNCPVPVQISRHPVTIGSETADVVVINNLTDRRKLRELDLMFRRLLAEWNLGTVFIDSRGRVRIHNEAARRYLGLADNFEGRSFCDVLPQLEPEMTGLELVRDDRYLLVTRSEWLETPDGRPWTVLTISDTTAQKKAELEMQRVRNLSSLGQVAAGVAHELRNPLTTIKGFSQLAVETEDPYRSKSHLAYVLQEVERMQEILNRFLMMSKPATPRYDPIDLRDIVLWIWDLVYNDSLARQIFLGRDLPAGALTVRGDAQQLRQVVLNLVNNAFEAVPDGGRVTISCTAEGEDAVLAVRDTGGGIPPGLMDEIFVPFVSTKDSGTGLGLAISREIVQKHGGRLEVESSPRGSTFRLVLPRMDTAPTIN